MKKTALLISLLLLALFIYFRKDPQNRGEEVTRSEKKESVSIALETKTQEKERPEPRDSDTDKKRENSENLSKKEYLKAKKVFQNFNQDTENLLKNWGKEKLQKYLTQASHELLQCLKEDLCGEERPADSPYFNPDNTNSHTHLEHNLGHLVFLDERGELDADLLTHDFLDELLALNNEGIQQKAIELKLSKGINSKNYNDLLEQTEGLKSKATLSSLAELSRFSKENSQHRQAFIQTLKRVVEANDQYRAVEVAKRIKNYGLSWEELQNLSEKIHCTQLPHNQKAIRHYLSIEAEGHGRELDLTCR